MKKLLLFLSGFSLLLTACGGSSGGQSDKRIVNPNSQSESEKHSNSTQPSITHKDSIAGIVPNRPNLPPIVDSTNDAQSPRKVITVEKTVPTITTGTGAGLRALLVLIDNEKQNDKVIIPENKSYTIGYGINTRNNLHNLEYQNKEFRFDNKNINFDHKFDVNHTDFFQIATAVERKDAVIIDYDKHSFLGIDNQQNIFAFGFKTNKTDLAQTNLHYFGSAILHYKNEKHIAKYLVAGFTGELNSNHFSGRIVSPLDEDNKYGTLSLYLSAKPSDESAVFTGNASAYKEIDDRKTEYHGATIKVQFNGKDAGGVSGVIYGSDVIGGGFAGTQDPVSNKELGISR